MTGNELLAEFDGIAANDLDPLATTTAAKLALLNIAARRVMHLLKIIRRSVPLAYVDGTTRYNLMSLSPPLDEANRACRIPAFEDAAPREQRSNQKACRR